MDAAKWGSVNDAARWLSKWGGMTTKVRVELLGLNRESFDNLAKASKTEVEQMRINRGKYTSNFDLLEIDLGSGVVVVATTRDINE